MPLTIMILDVVLLRVFTLDLTTCPSSRWMKFILSLLSLLSIWPFFYLIALSITCCFSLPPVYTVLRASHFTSSLFH